MNRLSPFSWLQLALSAVLLLSLAVRASAEAPQRIVSAGGSVTEIVYALGEGHRLVARDSTSNHPAAARALPNIGYVRRLSPEGLLSVNPDMILAEEGAGPPEALALLEESRIPLTTIPMGFDRDAVIAKIAAVARALGVPEKGRVLAERVAAEIDSAVSEGGKDAKSVLFILSMQGGRVMAAGSNTAADGMIALSGATNAVQGFEGYKPLTDEAILSAAPDVILLMQGRGDLNVPDEMLFAHPAIAATPAGQARAVMRMDGMLLLGFSVRTGQALRDLAQGLRGQQG